MRNILFYPSMMVAFLFLTNCTKVSAPPAKISIRIPSMKELKEKLPNHGPIHGMEDWDSANPQSIYDFNCFGVFVTGPEPEMRRNTCGRDDASIPDFPVGRWMGGVPSGSDIVLEVPAGTGRTIQVMGFKAQTGACMDFRTGNMPKSKLTKPTILGEVSGISLAPGQTTSVTVNVDFVATDTTKWFDKCNGPDFGSGQGGQNSVAATDFNVWASRQDVGNNVCQELNVTLTSGQNFNVFNTALKTFGITDAGTGSNFYTSLASCTAGTGNVSSFTIPANQTKTVVYFKPTTSGNHQYNIITTDFGGSMLRTSFVQSTVVSAANQFTINQNELLVPIGQCRETYVFATNSGYAANVSTNETITLAWNGVVPGGVITSDCNSTTAISSIVINSGESFAKFAIKATGSFADELFDIANYGTLSGSTQMTINPSPYAHHLDLSFNIPYVPHFTECVEMKITAYDAFGVPTPIPSPPGMSMWVEAKGGTKISTASNCSPLNNGVSLTFMNAASQTFYITGGSGSQTDLRVEFNPYQSARISSPFVSLSFLSRALIADPFNLSINMSKWFHVNDSSQFTGSVWNGIDNSRTPIALNCTLSCPSVGTAETFGNRTVYPMDLNSSYQGFNASTLGLSSFSATILMLDTDMSSYQLFKVTNANATSKIITASNATFGDGSFSLGGHLGLTQGYRMMTVTRLPHATNTYYTLQVGAGDPNTSPTFVINSDASNTSDIQISGESTSAHGKVLEFVLMNQAATQSQLASLKSYFEQKYGMTLQTVP